MMLIKTAKPNPHKFDAIFRIQTGQRVSLTSKVVTCTLPDRNSTIHLQKDVTYMATATDVFMELNGKVNRLFVDVSLDFGMGLKHIWLTDGPATIEGQTVLGSPIDN